MEVLKYKLYLSTMSSNTYTWEYTTPHLYIKSTKDPSKVQRNHTGLEGGRERKRLYWTKRVGKCKQYMQCIY